MRRFGLPVLPLIIGVILGPRVEEQLTQALAISQGDISTLWSEPVAIVVYAVMAVLLIGVVLGGLRKPADKDDDAPGGPGSTVLDRSTDLDAGASL